MLRKRLDGSDTDQSKDELKHAIRCDEDVLFTWSLLTVHLPEIEVCIGTMRSCVKRSVSRNFTSLAASRAGPNSRKNVTIYNMKISNMHVSEYSYSIIVAIHTCTVSIQYMVHEYACTPVIRNPPIISWLKSILALCPALYSVL